MQQRLTPRAVAYGLAFLFAVAIACDLLWMPIQVADSLGEIVEARQSSSAWASFTESFGSEAYLRPMRIAQIKAVFDAAHGHYWLAYRGVHALLLIAAVALFARSLAVSTAIDAAAAAFALVVMLGIQTFRGTVQEAFPINHFLEIVVACLLTLNLARGRSRAWTDVAAVLTFTVAALTLESGLLVWVVAATAWLLGWRGISWRGVGVMTLALAAYMYLRFVYLATGVPSLAERSAGYLLTTLDPPEIQSRFGAHPLWFHAYNVMASVSSVLFAEPQSGVFEAVRAWLEDAPLLRAFVPVATSAATTGLMVWAVLRRLSRRAEMDDVMRFFVMFLMVLVANAVLSFAYTKDEIMSTAGVFYALAAFGAAREGLIRASERPGTAGAVVAVLLCVLSVGWTVQTAGVHYHLRSQAIKHQIDWVDLPAEWRRNADWPDDPADQQLILQLRNEAVGLSLPNTRVGRPRWPDRLWIE